MVNADQKPKFEIVWPQATEPEFLGGKGAGLAKMLAASLPVPPFFALSLPRVADQDDFEIPPFVFQDLATAAHQISTPPWAVRSSAWGEDGSSASFAGLFHSVLGVTTDSELFDAVRQCSDSLRLARVKQYCEAKGMPLPSRMTIIVQQFITPRAAGIAFGKHPVLQNQDSILLEGSWGAGTTVVSGLVTPDRWFVSRDASRVERFELGNKTIMDVWRENSLVRVQVTRDKRMHPCLSEAEVLHLARLVRKTEAAVGYSPDIEWVCDDHHIYLVQCRPVTSASLNGIPSQTSR
jgi:phosphoenolpyruvate synthase/pyruvate phosphate dikinase